jgi:nicotinamide mononucleotide transporter PnuC
MKKWNVFERILFLGGIGIIVATSIIFDTWWLGILTVVFGFLNAFFQSKGHITAPFFGIVYVIIYAFSSYITKYYGEAIISIFIELPLCIAAAVGWLRHKNKTTIIVSNIKLTEWIISATACLAISVGIYFMLSAFNTEQLLISTLSFMAALYGSYLATRRVKWSSIGLTLNDIFSGILWGVLLFGGGISYLPLFINFTLYFFCDIYIIINWKRIATNQ